MQGSDKHSLHLYIVHVQTKSVKIRMSGGESYL